MRFAVPALVVLGGLWILPAIAADLPVQESTAPVAPAPAPSSIIPPRFLSELRLGVSAQDPWSPEAGSANATGELVFAKPFTSSDPVLDLFLPRIHVGGSLNTAGKTSFAYAGLTWTYDITQALFVEATFGGAVNNGKTGEIVPDHHNALGCNASFRESASIGWRFTQNWSVMATIEHLSNAGICDQNRGLTNVGARVAYHF